MSYPDFVHPFHLFTDASHTAVGYILGKILDGKQDVIAYGGRELSHAETRYSTTEREALAAVDGIKHYQQYMCGDKALHSYQPWQFIMAHECERSSWSPCLLGSMSTAIRFLNHPSSQNYKW